MITGAWSQLSVAVAYSVESGCVYTSSCVESHSTDLSDVSQTLQTAWESYRQRFEGVDEDLERSFVKLQDAVENQQRLVQEFVRQLDQSFEKALSGLSGGIDGIDSSVQNLADELERFNGPNRPN